MKFAVKIFLSTVLIIAVGFCIGGAILISGNFESARTARSERAIAEHYTLRYFFETELVTAIAKGTAIDIPALSEMGKVTAAKLSWNEQAICITAADMTEIYSSLPKELVMSDLQKILSGQTTCTTQKTSDGYTMLVSSLSQTQNLSFYLTAATDVTALFSERDRQLRAFFIISLILLLISSAALFGVAALLTRPISRLRKAAKRLANGAYGERVQAGGNDEVAELTDSFNQMAEAVEKNVNRLTDYAKSRDDFVSNFSHELKTPMTSIMGYADLLRSQKCDEDTTLEAAVYIFNEAKRLEELSHQLLKLMTLRQTQAELASHALLPILEQTIAIASPLCNKSGVLLSLSASPAQILCDPPLLQALLLNLIDNARKACASGGRIELKTANTSDQVTISVADNGCGLEQNQLAKISEPFYMLDKSRSHSGERGAGLGLSICNEIARLHHTQLAIESSLGQGTAVTLQLDRGETDEN